MGTVLRQSRRIARRAEPPARGRLTTRSSMLVGTIERLEKRTRRICNGERVPRRRGPPWRWPGIPRRIGGPFATSAAKPSGSRRSLRHHIPDSVPTACPGHRYALQESSALRRSRGTPPHQLRSYRIASVPRNPPTVARRDAPLAGSVQVSGLPHRRTAPGLLDTSQDEATAAHSHCSQPLIARSPSPSISADDVPILVTLSGLMPCRADHLVCRLRRQRMTKIAMEHFLGRPVGTDPTVVEPNHPRAPCL